MSKAATIDEYFRAVDAYPHIPYRRIGETLVDEVERMGPGGLWISTACALVEQESGAKNLMGCDWGAEWTNEPPYCHVRVTRARVEALIRNVNVGGGQNGIGLTQLTSLDYVLKAQSLGGAWKPRYQMRVGFALLLENIELLGFQAGAAAYNAGRGNWRAVYNTYGREVVQKQQKWQRRLA